MNATNLQYCTQCGHLVAKVAPRCPGCGTPPKASSYAAERERPSNVVRFEQLMYLTIVIGLILSALNWNGMVVQASAVGGAGFVLLVQSFSFAVLVLFIWLVARRRKNWARWLLVILFVVGLPTALRLMLHSQLLSAVLSFLQLFIEVIAFLLIFTGNATDWFQKNTCPKQPLKGFLSGNR